MPKRKSRTAPLGLLILAVILSGGAAFLIYTTWRQLHDHPPYLNKPLSEQETLKLEYIFNTHADGILGIDISHYQGNIKWNELELKIKDRPVEFFILRATMGDDQDELFKEYWNTLDTMKVIKGAYHYFRPNQNSTLQAKNFIKNVKLKPGDFRPILDIEKHSTIQSKERLRVGIQNWLNLVEDHYGVKPIIYTGDSFNTDVLLGHGFEDYPLWVANYNPIKEPKSEFWVIWQFTEKGRLKGINENVDLNILRGGSKTLMALLLE